MVGGLKNATVSVGAITIWFVSCCSIATIFFLDLTYIHCQCNVMKSDSFFLSCFTINFLLNYFTTNLYMLTNFDSLGLQLWTLTVAFGFTGSTRLAEKSPRELVGVVLFNEIFVSKNNSDDSNFLLLLNYISPEIIVALQCESFK